MPEIFTLTFAYKSFFIQFPSINTQKFIKNTDILSTNVLSTKEITYSNCD